MATLPIHAAQMGGIVAISRPADLAGLRGKSHKSGCVVNGLIPVRDYLLTRQQQRQDDCLLSGLWGNQLYDAQSIKRCHPHLSGESWDPGEEPRISRL